MCCSLASDWQQETRCTLPVQQAPSQVREAVQACKNLPTPHLSMFKGGSYGSLTASQVRATIARGVASSEGRRSHFVCALCSVTLA